MKMGPFLSAVLVGFLLAPRICAQEAPGHASSRGEEGRYRSALLFASVIELIRDEYLDPAKTDYEKMTHAALRASCLHWIPTANFWTRKTIT